MDEKEKEIAHLLAVLVAGGVKVTLCPTQDHCKGRFQVETVRRGMFWSRRGNNMRTLLRVASQVWENQFDQEMKERTACIQADREALLPEFED